MVSIFSHPFYTGCRTIVQTYACNVTLICSRGSLCRIKRRGESYASASWLFSNECSGWMALGGCKSLSPNV